MRVSQYETGQGRQACAAAWLGARSACLAPSPIIDNSRASAKLQELRQYGGALQPVVHRRFRIADVKEAHAYLLTNQHVGKRVIEVIRS